MFSIVAIIKQLVSLSAGHDVNDISSPFLSFTHDKTEVKKLPRVGGSFADSDSDGWLLYNRMLSSSLSNNNQVWFHFWKNCDPARPPDVWKNSFKTILRESRYWSIVSLL